jgi:hypothetical protein
MMTTHVKVKINIPYRKVRQIAKAIEMAAASGQSAPKKRGEA